MIFIFWGIVLQNQIYLSFFISLICTMIDDCATEHDYDYNDQTLNINS